MSQTISCPHCGEKVAVEDVLRQEIELSVKKSLEVTHKEELTRLEKEVFEKAQKELEDKSKSELNELKRELEEKNKKMEEFRKEELELRAEKRKLDEAQKEFELTVARKMDEERNKIEEATSRKLSEEFHYKEKEKEKIISDLKKALEDAQRKAHQGSQQLQGEVLELDFEKLLSQEFPDDVIEPVGKGIKGADVRQIVKSPRGVMCGTILWENKRTKTWDDKWISKLKDDVRAEKANFAVIVTTTLPKDMSRGMEYRDGAWITRTDLAIPLAVLLRRNLLDIGYQKAVIAHRGNKAEQLYSYITSHEFRQEIEAIVELYSETKMQISKERMAFERQWKLREKQAEKLFSTTARLVGGIQGEVGQTALPVKGLELLDTSDD